MNVIATPPLPAGLIVDQAPQKQKLLYLIGALKNEVVPKLGVKLRALGFDVFDDWYGAGPEADVKWREYEQIRGRRYADALQGRAAHHIFNFDYTYLMQADVGVLVMPAGKSGHLELGFVAGRGKPTFIYFPDEKEPDPDRWDLMYRFAKRVCFGEAELIENLKKEL